ncbi:MAG: hypothetical protein ACREQ8_09845 [Woeseiaceae bacterium]
MTVLGLLASPLAIWSLHFLLAYVSAAVYCARSGDHEAAMSPVRSIVLALTIAALAAVALALRRGYRRFARNASLHRHPAAGVQTDPARFFRIMLLWFSVLSAVAIVCVGSVTLFFGNCR